MKENIKEILYTSQQLTDKAAALGAAITRDCGDDIVVVGVLKGSFMFLSDLVKNIDKDCVIDFVRVSSYGDSMTSGELVLKTDISVDIENKDVIIVEDILDTGKTLEFLKRHFEEKNPRSVKICTLLDKKVKKECYVKADYVGFEIEDLFVVGYGLDYGEKYRNLPYIAVI